MWYIVINKILFQLLIFFISIVDKSNKKKIISFFQKKFNLNPINVIDIGAHKGETIDLFF